MTDTINVNGSFANAASVGAFGKKGDMANANWLNQDYNLKARFAAMKAKTPIDPNSPQYNQLKQSINTHNANNAARMAAERADARAQAAAARVQAAAARAQYSQMRRSADEDNRLYTRRASISDAARNALYPSQRANVLNRARGIPGADLSGLTPLAGTYYNQEAHRIGSVGTSAANRGNFSQFMRSDKILTKMSSTLEKYVKANIHTQEEQEAARVTARRVLAGSFSQMSSAAEFAPGLSGMAMRLVISGRAARARRAAGGDFVSGEGGYGGGGGAGGGSGGGRKGGLGGFVSAAGGAALGAAGLGIEGIMAAAGPIGITAAAAAAALGADYEVPNATAALYSKVYSDSKPWLDLSNAAGAMGMNGGYNSNDLMKSIFSPNITKGRPAWMAKYGMTQQDASSIMQNYGIVPTSAGGVESVLHSIAKMKSMPGLAGLSDADRTQIAQSSSIYGMAGGIHQFQKVLIDAIAVGGNKIQVLQSMNSILSQNAALGTPAGNGRATARLFSTMLSSGAPGAKTGALEATLAGAVGNTMANMGSDPVSTVPMIAYIMSHGGIPKTAAAEKKLLEGLSPGLYDTLNAKNNPAGRRLLRGLRQSGGGYFAAQDLANMLGNNVPAAMKIASSFIPGFNQMGPAQQNALVARMLNTTSGTVNGYLAGSGPLSTPGSPVSAAMKNAVSKTGIDPSVLYGIIGGESGFNPNAPTTGNGDAGLGQVGPDALKDIHMAGANMKDPKQAALAAAKYYLLMYSKFNGKGLTKEQHTLDALEAYNMGPSPGHIKDILSGNVSSAVSSNAASKLKYMQAYSSSNGGTDDDLVANMQNIILGGALKAAKGDTGTQAAKNDFDMAGASLVTTAGYAAGASQQIDKLNTSMSGFITWLTTANSIQKPWTGSSRFPSAGKQH